MKNFILIIALTVIGVCLHATEKQKPNIIVILSDDMGITDIGCYGSEIETPNLDKLAANGLRFSQFYNTGRCCPTRASLLTGLYPHQAGIGHMMGNRGVDGYRGNLAKDAVTIAEVLKPAGYATYMVGKWHVTPKPNKLPVDERLKHNWPLQRGFDKFYGTIHGAHSFWDPATLTRGNTLISPVTDQHYQPTTPYYYTDAISDHAVRYVKEHDPSKPFFMYVAYTAAHWPLHAHEHDIKKYKGKYDVGYRAIREARYKKAKELGLLGDESAMSPQVGDLTKIKYKEQEFLNMETYAAMVDSMDQGIGKIIKQLEASGQLENTLVMYLQDNGACAEDWLKNGKHKGARKDKPSLPPMKADAIQLDMVPKQTRDGYPVRLGYDIYAGPADTYQMYNEYWANVSNTPFRLYKHYVHEGGIATPLVVHWPKGITAKNEWRRSPSHLIDIMATAVDLAKAEYPKEYKGKKIQPLEGKSLISVFSEDKIERDYLYWEHERNCAIRQGDWKLVGRNVLHNTGVHEKKWELYDLSKDRSELNNLAKKYPERVKAMSKAYLEHARKAKVIPFKR